MKKYTVLLVTTIVALAMMVGVQSALAGKPTDEVPATGIANGQVNYIYSSLDCVVGPTEEVSGPWKLIVHPDPPAQGTINFSATCQTSIGVVKISAKGTPASMDYNDSTQVLTITGVDFTIKCKGEKAGRTGEITVNASTMEVDFGDPVPPETVNLRGDVRLFKSAPPWVLE